MMKRFTRSYWRVLLAGMPIVLGSVAMAADRTEIVNKRPVMRVAPERTIGGITVEQYQAHHLRLHKELSAIVPDGVRGKTISVELTEQDRIDVATPRNNPAAGEPLRIGVVKTLRSAVDIIGAKSLKKRGVYQETDNGGFIWAITITSPDAGAIRIHFRNFSLPDNASMYFFNQEGTAFGPYEGQGRNNNGDFWTRSMASETGTILLRVDGPVTDRDRRSIRFIIDRVGHITQAGRNPFPAPDPQSHDSWPCSNNASCVVDANCVSGTPADIAKDAVAKMEWIRRPFIFTCTGGLIADTDTSTQRALFLSANHCLDKDQSNMETFFFYTTDSCNGTCPDNRLGGSNPPAPNTIGMTVLATGRDGDFTLMELNGTPPAGTAFLGFNNSEIAFTEGAKLYRISNPNFGPQAYSQHDVDTTAGTCTGFPRGEMIYSNDVTGATMGGSSGSPVVNSASEIVGQLFGCCGFNCGDVCDSASNSTIDGPLAFYYDNVAPFLDPAGCTPSTEVCDNGIDDDCDGAIDCADGDCSADPACECVPSTEVCDNGIDDDCDGAIDCADTDCSADPACNCTLGQKGDSCLDDTDCCSNKCRGRTGAKTCKN